MKVPLFNFTVVRAGLRQAKLCEVLALHGELDGELVPPRRVAHQQLVGQLSPIEEPSLKLAVRWAVDGRGGLQLDLPQLLLRDRVKHLLVAETTLISRLFQDLAQRSTFEKSTEFPSLSLPLQLEGQQWFKRCFKQDLHIPGTTQVGGWTWTTRLDLVNIGR